MKCDQVQTLHGPYLDSELDAKTTLEIGQHLKGCPNCARLFVEEQKLDSHVMGGLKRGPRTAALWEQLEREVVAAGSAISRPRPPRHVSQPVGWPALLGALGAQLRAGWQASRWAWAGLAGVWVVILALHFTAREPDAPLLAGQEAPSTSELRLALKQQQLLMAELGVAAEPVPATKPKATGAPKP
jgi:anti-sigma factor RsiW